MRRRSRSLRRAGALALGVALAAAAAAPAGGQALPEHLASMGRTLYDAWEREAGGDEETTRAATALPDAAAVSDPGTPGTMAAGEAPRAADANAPARRALAMLRRAGVHRWAARPLRLPGAADALARRVPAELGGPPQGAELAALVAGVAAGDAEGALARLLRARGRTASPQAQRDLAQTLGGVWGEAWGDRATRHVLRAGPGEEIEVGWLPEASRAYLRARATGDGSAPPFEALRRGEAGLRSDPATGDLLLGTTPLDEPVRVLDEGERRRLEASILGTWRGSDGGVYRISAVDAGAGRVPPDPARLQAAIDALEARIETLRRAKIYVWRDEATGRVVRQTRFQRLEAPFVYEGERFDETDAEARIAELEADVAALQIERDAAAKRRANRPRALRDGLEDAEALRVGVSVRRPDGYAYTFDTARFDGRRLVAERTYRDVRDVDNPGLPEAVRTQLVASWSPGAWIELEATLDPASGEEALGGTIWTQHVTYSRGAFGAGDPTVKSVHSPRPRSLRLHRDGVRLRSAEAAPRGAAP